MDDKELPNLNSIGGLIDSWTYNSGRVHPNKNFLNSFFDVLIEKLLRGLISIKTKKHLIPLLLIDIHTPRIVSNHCSLFQMSQEFDILNGTDEFPYPTSIIQTDFKNFDSDSHEIDLFYIKIIDLVRLIL